ncbi:hypothetical protein [Herbidospora galbida]|uniref:hypothetical protein n=1 Tax=Herbidospora galbida TaxID=2575442 RepID=UPI001BAFC8FD|nr:hypothetical protein [Herbidospora galbida]
MEILGVLTHIVHAATKALSDEQFGSTGQWGDASVEGFDGVPVGNALSVDHRHEGGTPLPGRGAEFIFTRSKPISIGSASGVMETLP